MKEPRKKQDQQRPKKGPDTEYDSHCVQKATAVLEEAEDESTPPDTGGTEPETRELCAKLSPAEVSYDFRFRNINPLGPAIPPSRVQLTVSEEKLRIACTIVEDATLVFADDLVFGQRWNLQRISVGDLGSVVALAPGESSTLTVKQTQRTSLTRNNIESTESLTSSENSQIDKDVMNVAKSTTKSSEWHVDTTASISYNAAGFNAGLSVNAGYRESTSTTVNKTLQRIAEATNKSAAQLKALQKTDVTQSHEVFDESLTKRQVSNPYRDRSLMLNVFDLNKTYNVTTELLDVQPALAFSLPKLRLDHSFILANADFLEAELLDTTVLDELRSALQAVRRQIDQVNEDEARRIALKALDFLFYEKVVTLDPDIVTSNYDITRSLNELNAASDTIGNNLGREFTTLLFYFRLFDSMSLQERERWAIRIAVTLSSSLGPDWLAAEDGPILAVLDEHNPTEVMRRLSGFISFVDKLLKPLLEPIADARVAQEASERAEFVIERIAGHLKCYEDYYTRRYLEHLFRKTQGLSFAKVLSDLLIETGREELLLYFDPSRGFLNGVTYVVPSRTLVSRGTSIRWGAALLAAKGIDNTAPMVTKSQHEVVIPTEGVHIEPSPGSCIMPEVPPIGSSLSTEIKIEASGNGDKSTRDDLLSGEG